MRWQALILLLSVSAPLRATPVDSLGLGARAKALAGAVAADARDYSANYYNPSQLAFVESVQIGLGYTQTELDLTYGEKPAKLPPAQAWVVGVVAPGSIADIPVAFGVAAYLPVGHLSKNRTIREGDPYWVFYEGRLQLLYTSVNIAVRPLAWWSLGLGTATLTTTKGGFEIRGTTVVPQGDRSEYESDLRHQVDADLISLRYPQYSMTLAPHPESRIGLCYREQADVDTRIEAVLDTEIDGTVIQIPLRYDILVTSVRMFIPRQLNLALAFTPGAWSFEVDLTWYDWSRYRSPVGSTTSSYEAELPEGVTLDLPATPAPPALADPRFRDRVVPRLGIEHRLPLTGSLELPLRIGYVYEASPVPPQSGRTNFLDSDRHLLSMGAGAWWSGFDPILSGMLRTDFAVQFGLLERRSQTKADRASGLGSFAIDGHFWAVSGDVIAEF